MTPMRLKQQLMEQYVRSSLHAARIEELEAENAELRAILEAAIVWASDAPRPYREWPFIVSARNAIAKAKGTT